MHPIDLQRYLMGAAALAILFLISTVMVRFFRLARESDRQKGEDENRRAMRRAMARVQAKLRRSLRPLGLRRVNLRGEQPPRRWAPYKRLHKRIRLPSDKHRK